ncbi:ph domain-containing protein [Lipomyces arxii]|uniref:ph domain-containing protein n=1 Tax=Lipomyces arxii TaxID=56418 RepID=UPI0034CFD957
MTSLIGKYVARRLFKETAHNAFGTEDPYFEEIPQDEINGRPKKAKKRKRPPPPGLSENDKKVLTRVKRRAYYLDMALCSCCCGVGVGWSSVIGFIPVIGDVIALYLSLSVLRTAAMVDGGLPGWLQSKMMANIVIDFMIGLIPFAGDVIDVLYKANSRNALLLEKFLRDRGAANLKTEASANPSALSSAPDRPGPAAAAGPAEQRPAKTGSGGWFKWYRSNANEGTEMGTVSRRQEREL